MDVLKEDNDSKLKKDEEKKNATKKLKKLTKKHK